MSEETKLETLSLEFLKQEAKEDLKINPMQLDSESLRTPMVYQKWLDFLTDEGMVLKKLLLREKKEYKRLWEYYGGKSPQKIYNEKPLNATVMKSDIDKYLDANPEWAKLQEIVDSQKKKVAYIENVMKMINNRSFQIRDAINWRQFQAGGG